jgi:hypothetical protein
MACAGAIALLACGDDDNAGTPDSGTDGGQDTGTDTGADTARPDAGGDADAGATVTSTIGATGSIEIFNDAVIAVFREDDEIVRFSNVADCVLHVFSFSKPQSSGGQVTVAGDIVGSDGGTPTPIVLDPTFIEPTGWDYFMPGDVFPSAPQLAIQVSTAGTPSFAALPLQALRTPPAGTVVMTSPVRPDAGALALSVTQALPVTWTPPAGNQADQRLWVVIQVSGNPKSGELRCSFPLPQGNASIPANVFAETKKRIPTLTGPPIGLMQVFAGGYKEVVTASASFIIEVSRGDTTGLTQPAVDVTIP